MIARVWHGWTTHENADTYENLLKEEIFPGIATKNVAGYAVREFAGEDYQCAYVPAKAQEVLARFDKRSAHYEVKERLEY